LKLGVGEGVLPELNIGIPGREGSGEEFGREACGIGIAATEQMAGEIETGGVENPRAAGVEQ
jgi:hypothetical protein